MSRFKQSKRSMHYLRKGWMRGFLLVFMALFSADAIAQTCSDVARTIQQIERNRDFRNLTRNTQTAQSLSSDLSRLERSFVNAGCQRALNAGQRLNRDCQTAARQITRGRSNMETLKRQVESGRALALQREQLRQRYVLGNCQAAQAQQQQQQSRGGNLFERFFNALSGSRSRSNVVVDHDLSYFFGTTYRSVCVRKSDGYYWPISFATVREYLPKDQAQCLAACPLAEVELYYHLNPQEGPEEMVNLRGEPYVALPNAFAYRESFNSEYKCQEDAAVAQIEIEDTGDGSRAILTLGEDLRVPLPLRDPRREAPSVQIAVAQVYVPLPRKRPDFEGVNPPETRTAILEDEEMRLVQVGDKVVRIVGPETPYAQ